MAPKIKNLQTKPTSKRKCFICGKEKAMEKHQRFCSPACKAAAADIGRFGSEHKIAVSKK